MNQRYEALLWSRALCDSPVITAEPSSAIACPEGEASFSVSLSGTGPHSVQWQVEVGPEGWQTLTNEPMQLPCGGLVSARLTGIWAAAIAVRQCSGGSHALTPQQFRIRCVADGPCGSVFSREAVYTICPADFNCSGSLSVQDIFDFLYHYFALDAAADINRSGEVSLQDVFDLLSAYFSGCD